MKPARPEPARFRSVAIGVRAAGALALAAVLASCSLFGGDGGSKDANRGQPDPAIAAAAPAELRSFYTQQVNWTACETDFQCAKIKVPLDYSKPDGERIEIAAIKLPTGSTKRAACWSTPADPAARGTTSSRTPRPPTSRTGSARTTTSSVSTRGE